MRNAPGRIFRLAFAAAALLLPAACVEAYPPAGYGYEPPQPVYYPPAYGNPTPYYYDPGPGVFFEERLRDDRRREEIRREEVRREEERRRVEDRRRADERREADRRPPAAAPPNRPPQPPAAQPSRPADQSRDRRGSDCDRRTTTDCRR